MIATLNLKVEFTIPKSDQTAYATVTSGHYLNRASCSSVYNYVVEGTTVKVLEPAVANGYLSATGSKVQIIDQPASAYSSIQAPAGCIGYLIPGYLENKQ